MVRKKCFFCTAGAFFLCGALSGVMPFTGLCTCTKRKVNVEISWTFVVLSLGFILLRLSIAIYGVHRIISDLVMDMDMIIQFLLYGITFFEVVAILTAMPKINTLRMFEQNFAELLECYKYISPWSNMEEKLLDETYWIVRLSWLGAVTNAVIIFGFYIPSGCKLVILILSTSLFIMIQNIMTMAVINKLHISVLKCCYTDIKKCVSFKSNENVVRINTFHRLQRLLDFQNSVVKNHEVANKFAGASVLVYYLAAQILSILALTVSALIIMPDTIMIPSLLWLIIAMYLMILFFCLTVFVASTMDTAMSVGDDLRSFLYRLQLSRLGNEETLMVETVLETLNHRILTMRPGGGIITLQLKMCAQTFRHGFPFNPTAMAYDPVQKLLAIGSKCGSLRILGQPGVDVYVRHDMDGPPSSAAVLQLQFMINEGTLISATADDSVHLWNIKQKVPQIVQSLKFQKEKITYMHLPLQSKWLYVGTERGNVHIVQIDTFSLSGYVINWNKAMEMTRKTHPGAVVHLSDNPLDASKLLIGFESGQISLWDLRSKAADIRFQTAEPLRSIAWHHEGKQFMCSHTDGSLTTWTIKQSNKPIHVSQPHAKINKDGKLEQCKAINKIEWKSSRSGEAYVVFSGGMPYDQAGRTPSITVVYNKTTTVLEMEHNVIDFITLCESPYPSELQEPYAIIALLQNDLVVMDLQTAGFPCLENPYPMDVHESPVTSCSYLVDCPADLIPAFYSVGRSGSSKKMGFSEKEWPISGGTWSAQSCSYSEIIMTGHADGSIKFWDASAGTLQVLYKLKTAKIFEKPKVKSVDGDDDPFAIELISLCPESRKLCVAGASSHVVVFSYKKTEVSEEVPVLEIPIVYEIPDDSEYSPDCQLSAGSGSAGSSTRLDMLDYDNKKEVASLLKVRGGLLKKLPGFQAQLVCLTPCNNGEPPSRITALTLNSSYGLMAYGNEAGIVIVDIEQRVCLLNVGSPDLYGAQDPYSRALRSPKKNNASSDVLPIEQGDRQPRSPSIDQMESPIPCPCPTPVEPAYEATEEDTGVQIPQVQPAQATRRRPSVWKTFNIKKQLSKVDLKIKSTFADGGDHSKEKRHSLFYSEISPNNDFDPQGDLTPDSDDNTLVDNQNCSSPPLTPKQKSYDEDAINENEEDEVPFIVGSLGSPHEVPKKFNHPRPDNLDLVDENGFPIRPPRLKKVSDMHRRENRLLSVPIIKLQKTDLQKLRDLRNKDEREASKEASFAGNLIRRFNKLENTFSRSRSSSMSSLENITAEAIQCLAFADSYTKRSEPNCLTPTLWVGTSLGSVLTIIITPPDPDSRSSQPVAVSLVGVTIFRLKGSILNMSFLDCNGALIPYTFESWKDDNRERRDNSLGTPTKNQNRTSPTMGDFQPKPDTFGDRQFVVITSEKQARVVALPSQTCVYRQQIADTDFVVRAEIVSLKDSVCLVCFVSSGHLMAYSLPSLRPLIDIDFLPLSELRIAKTFCFSNRGHGLYLSSPSELQKFTLCTEFCTNLTEMLGELFIPAEMPEPPKESFFKGLFGGGVRSLDREELFGESSGKANKTVAKHIPGAMQEMNQRVNSSTNEISRAHKLVLERGEKLNRLEDTAEKMRNEAENYASTSHELMLKYKDKKWYQL